jgi:hypothetical protein
MDKPTIYAAYCKAAAEIQDPELDSTFKMKLQSGAVIESKYSSIHAIREAIREPLKANGLWYFQQVRENQLVTVLCHESGETIECPVPISAPTTAPPQTYGSALSYSRRYSLQTLLGLGGGPDEAGGSAQDAAEKQRDHKAKREADMPTFQDHQAKLELSQSLDELKRTYTAAIKWARSVQRDDLAAKLTATKDERRKFLRDMVPVSTTT